MGYWASKFLHNDGGKITTIIEHDIALYKKDGFNPDEVEAWKIKNGTLKNYKSNCDEVNAENPAKFMERDVDILIPAAVEKSVHKGNADRILAKVVAEAANGPTTFAAEQILLKKGKVIIPDLILNGGGVTVSYFEWLKNLQHVAPGRLTKKWEEQSQKNLYNMIKGGGDHSKQYEKNFFKGATEKDIVYSGLDEIMSNTIMENWNNSHKYADNLRVTALVSALDKIALAYKHNGLLF